MMRRIPRWAVPAILTAVLGCGAGRSDDGCTSSIADFCAGANASTCDWTAYSAAAKADCHTGLGACGPYDVGNEMGVDAGTMRYFDAANGRLVAIVEYVTRGGGTRRCAAGPTGGFAEPDCSSTLWRTGCP